MKNTQADQNLTTPGPLLLKAREAQDISAEMVAQHLRLDTDLVHALENDDYAKFPAVAYVRGHLRGYANMVDLNGDKLVKLFDQSAKKAPAIEPFVSQPEPQASSGDRHIRAVTYSLIAALVLLLALWWQTHRPSVETTVELNQEMSITPEQEQEESIETVILEGSSGILPLPEISLETTTVQEEPMELQHDYSLVTFSELPEPPEQGVETELTGAGLELSAQNNANGLEISSMPSAADPIRIENQGIIMQFTDESWVQITDANNSKLFSALGKAGEVVNVTGLAPFRIVIGKASAVIMSYQGDFIDLDPLARNEVARFTIDENGAHR